MARLTKSSRPSVSNGLRGSSPALPLTLRAELPGVTQDFENSRVKTGIRGFNHPGQVDAAVRVSAAAPADRVALLSVHQGEPASQRPFCSSKWAKQCRDYCPRIALLEHLQRRQEPAQPNHKHKPVLNRS